MMSCQDSRRINQEEIDQLEFEKNSRARLHQLAKERAVAEASGVAQMAGLQEQLSSVETRLNQLKQQLYFPDVKGYKYALLTSMYLYSCCRTCFHLEAHSLLLAILSLITTCLQTLELTQAKCT